MTGGQLNLVTSRGGAGADIINVNPQITFFRKVYKRYTNFGMESIEQTISGTANFGSTVKVAFSNSGTLLSNIVLEVVLPAISTGIVSGTPEYAQWTNAVGYALYESITLLINSKKIDKHTGLWLDVWNELTDPNRNEWALVGKVETPKKLENPLTKKTKYYLPLKFFFNRHPGLSLPVTVMGDNSVELEIKFSALNKLIWTDGSIGSGSIDTFKVYADYIFLESNEEAKIRENLPTEYLIETLDSYEDQSLSSLPNYLFDNAVKEFIWVFRHTSRANNSNTEIRSSFKETTNGNDWFNYTNTNVNGDLYNTYDIFSTMSFTISNTLRFSARDALYFRKLQPYMYHSNSSTGKNIYVYSFALKPEDYQPSGTYNFSKNDDKVKFTFNDIPGHTTGGASSSDYKLNLFVPRYEYIYIYEGGAERRNVPVQAVVETIEQTAGIKGGKSKLKPIRIGTSGQQQLAQEKINLEKQRLEAASKKRDYLGDHLHTHEHSHSHIKRWSGYQGEYLNAVSRDVEEEKKKEKDKKK